MPVVDKELIHIQIIEYSSHLSPIRMFRRVASELEVRVCLLEVARFLLLFGSRFFLHDMWVPHWWPSPLSGLKLRRVVVCMHGLIEERGPRAELVPEGVRMGVSRHERLGIVTAYLCLWRVMGNRLWGRSKLYFFEGRNAKKSPYKALFAEQTMTGRRWWLGTEPI